MLFYHISLPHLMVASGALGTRIHLIVAIKYYLANWRNKHLT